MAKRHHDNEPTTLRVTADTHATATASDQGRRARPTGNRILDALPAAEYVRVAPAMETVHLSQHSVLQPVDEEIEHVFFPVRGVASLVASGPEGEQIDTAIIGVEGMVGLPVFLGTGRMPVQAIVQVDMEAVRMTADALREELEQQGAMVNLLQRYTQMVLVELAQLVLCNRAHSLEQRTARWLLRIDDRLATRAPIEVTQEFLASMVGSTRPHISEVMQEFRRAKLIALARGSVAISDGPALERRACTCYGLIRDEIERLLATSEQYDVTPAARR